MLWPQWLRQFTFCAAFSLSRCANGLVRGVSTQKGLALSARQIRNSSPCIVLIWPSNTVWYLLTTMLTSSNEVMDLTSLIGDTEGGKIGMGWGYCEGSKKRHLAAFQDMITTETCGYNVHIFLVLVSLKVESNWELSHWFHDVTVCGSWRNFRW